ncbi:MAG: AAA family ATPase [Bacteroidota bacterium]
MRLRSITIKGLFGIFNHSIPLKTKGRLTIIHGPNGVGKTTVLKLIHSIFRKDFFAVAKINFSEVKLAFTNGTVLRIARQDPSSAKAGANLVATLKQKNKDSSEYKIPIGRHSESEVAQRLNMPLGVIEDIIQPLTQVGPREWYDHGTGDVISLFEVILRYGDELPIKADGLFKVPAPISHALESLPVYFIQTQRLLSEEPVHHDFRYKPGLAKHRPGPRTVVERWAKDMSTRIQEKLRDSGELSASLDRQFPSTLLGASLPPHAKESKIREIYSEQTEVRNRLMKAGLIDVETLVGLPAGQIDASELKVLWFYFSDVRKKLSVFDDLLKKIELFKEIINSRFLRKSFSVDKESGFTVKSDDDKTIPLNALSSGEQHELVLTYELLFRVKQNSLILIDEPELSLHVTWQHKFLDDITRISELVDLDFLIATHSPSIIHDRSNLMTALS